MGSIKKNAFFNILLAVSQILFPLITFPYISRILQPQGVGAYTFVDSYTQYFVLIAALGIPVYGMREIAKTRHSLAERSKVFSELIILHLFITLCITLVYIGSFLLIPRLQPYTDLFWIGSTLLLSSAFLIEWFYQGMEKFPFITIRTLLIRFASIICIFLVIKKKSDVTYYYVINCTAVLLNAVINLWYSKRFVKFSISALEIKRHFKPLMFIFSSAIVSSVYTLLDSVILGFLTNVAQVGYYTTAVKLSKILIMLLAAFTTVLVPPLSLAFKENRSQDAKQLLQKSFDYVAFIGVPLSVGLYIIAKPLVLLFSGSSFLPAVNSLRLLAPTILFIGLSYVFGMQVLNPTGNERYFFLATFIGMIVSISANLLLIPWMEQLGAAITNLLVEFTVMAILIKFALNKADFQPRWQNIIKALFASLPFFGIVYLIELNHFSLLITLLLTCTLCATTYLCIQHFVWRNLLFKELLSILLKRK
ncbi:MAG TPA: flippase [Pseudosphingobacterium sp.]|nr:flippase [Pseudosphingobacterium sp.]